MGFDGTNCPPLVYGPGDPLGEDVTLRGFGNENLPSLLGSFALISLTRPNPSSQARPIVNRNINYEVKHLAHPEADLDQV